jgi:hypothetical protein
MIKNHDYRPVVLISGFLCLLAPGAQAGVKPEEHFPIATCQKGTLPAEVDSLVKPVLLARVAWARSTTHLDKAFEAAFYKFLDAKSSRALEAKVALLAYYIGEHYGEELLDAVLERPAQADALVRRYRACRLQTSFEAELDGLVVLRTQYDNYEYIRAQPK